MSAVLPSSAGHLKHRVLPGSVDLFIPCSTDADAAGGLGSAAESLNNKLQRQRRQRTYTAAAERDIVAQPPSVDVNVWLYEQLCAVLSELNSLLAALSPHCTAATCPVMVATADWEFLCAAHGSKPMKVMQHVHCTARQQHTTHSGLFTAAN